jgi:parallel beta-helix repeat protein
MAAVLVVGGLGTTPASAATFGPVADSYVNASSPTTNYGTNAQLRVDGSPVLNSFVRFDVQGVGSGVTSATLRLFANSSQSVGFSVHSVADNSWSESTVNYNTQPAFGPAVDTTGPVTAGTWYDLNVTSLVTGNGLRSFAITTGHTTALSLASKESPNPPQLIVLTSGPTPPPVTPTATPVVTPSPTPAVTPPPSGRLTVITRVGNTYIADAQWSGGNDYSGPSLKIIGEAAIEDMDDAGGGKIQFEAGNFDLGTGDFHLRNIANIEFAGRGIDETILRNNTSVSADTEPWNMGGTDFITIRDMTVHAAGAFRSTSDAIDFDDGNHTLIERVKVTSSRARGIIFDGKGPDGGAANNNVVRDCVITAGVPSDGIELLASSNNRIEHCTITGVGGHGIQATKASTSAAQPNKKSSDNVFINNIIQNAASDGINIVSGDRNKAQNNSVSLNGRDGIRVDSSSSISSNQNQVTGNTSIQNDRWGLNINNSGCNSTVVSGNVFSGNGSGAYRDAGTGTID